MDAFNLMTVWCMVQFMYLGDYPDSVDSDDVVDAEDSDASDEDSNE